MEEQNARRRRPQEKILILYWLVRTTNSFSSELFKGHSGRNPIDPSLQDNVLFLDNFFEYIYHIGCAINLHSITNSGLIPGGQNFSRERQTVLFTAVNPMDKEHKDPYKLDLTKPRLAWYKSRKSGGDIKTRCTGSIESLPQQKRIQVQSNKM